MEWRFFVEVKSFLFSVKEDVAVVRLEERRKGFAGVFGSSMCSLVGCNGGGSVAQHWDEGFHQILPRGSVSLDHSPR
jgi:hypothetical protein